MIALPAGAHVVVAVGWATVELERAAMELAHLLALGATFETAPASVLLGAQCRVGTAAERPGLWIVLLEPDSEGRLAASLARSAEGWVATWAVDEAAATDPPGADDGPQAPRARLSAPRPGPLGNERLLLAGPLPGPHRLFIDAVPSPP